MLRVGIRAGDKTRTPLLLFNGIGASIELIAPFLEQLEEPEAIIFDVPGVGGSPTPLLPYRPSTLARPCPVPARADSRPMVTSRSRVSPGIT